MNSSLALSRRGAAECLGTFALVTGGCGAIEVNHGTGALGHVGVAASFGLVIMVMIAAVALDALWGRLRAPGLT